MQATFLRGPVAGEENAELAAELEVLPDEELETRCRRSGLSKRGGRGAQICRQCCMQSFLSITKSSCRELPMPLRKEWQQYKKLMTERPAECACLQCEVEC